MSEVHRYKVVTMLSEDGNKISYKPHGPEVVTARDYDAAQSELAALREELTEANRQIELRDELGCMTCGGDGHVHRLDGEYLGPCTSCFAYEFSCTKYSLEQTQQRLAAAEQRNSVMTECLERLRGCSQLRPTPNLVELIDSALKHTESGASE